MRASTAGHSVLRLPIESCESGEQAFEIRPSSPVVFFDRRVSIAGAAHTASSIGPLPPAHF